MQARSMHVVPSRIVLLVEPGTELAGLSCRACHAPVRPGDSVLLTFRAGQPSVLHARLCRTSPSREPAHPAAPLSRALV